MPRQKNVVVKRQRRRLAFTDQFRVANWLVKNWSKFETMSITKATELANRELALAMSTQSLRKIVKDIGYNWPGNNNRSAQRLIAKAEKALADLKALVSKG